MSAMAGLSIIVTFFALIINLFAWLLSPEKLALYLLIILFILLVSCAIMKCFGGKNEGV